MATEIKTLSNYPLRDITARKKIAELESHLGVGSVLYLFPNLSDGGYSGNCSLMVTPSKTVLFDCGPTSDWIAIKRYFDTLYDGGIFTNIDYIIISHFHYDHIQNLGSILSTYPHSNCHAYIPMNPSDYCSYDVSENRNSVISSLTANSVTYTEVSNDTTVTVDEGFVSVELFNSSVSDYTYYSNLSTAYNNYCMVALVKTGNVYSMFPADIQRDAQIRIVGARKLPRLFLYCVHHHGIQNDDYRPYLEAINPEYSVIMTSHNRALVSSASSYSGNYLAGEVGSTGFSSYEYVCGKDGGSIISGTVVPKIGWYYSYVDLYVDNTYTGLIYDGTEANPFTEINEAIMFIQPEANLHYRIHVKGTGTTYGYLWVRDMNVAIEVIGEKGSNNEYPSVDGVYMRNCNNVSFYNVNFDGDGRNINEHISVVYAWATTACSFNNCKIDGVNGGTGSVYPVQIREGHLYLANCEISNGSNGIGTYREGSVTTNSITFNNIRSACYYLSNLSVTVRGADAVTNCVNWMAGNLATARPYVIAKNCLNSSLLALNTTSAVSCNFYYDADNPVCVCQGGKVLNVLTGTEVAIS